MSNNIGNSTPPAPTFAPTSAECCAPAPAESSCGCTPTARGNACC